MLDTPQSVEQARRTIHEAREKAKAGAFDDACKLAVAPLRDFPGDVEIRHVAGVMYSIAGDFDAALGQFAAALAIDPGFKYSLMEVALIHHARREFEDAIAFYTKATHADIGWDLPRRRAAAACRELGDYERADEIFAGMAKAGLDDADFDAERAANRASLTRKRNVRALLDALPPRDGQLGTVGSPSPPAGWAKVRLVCAESGGRSSSTFDELMDGLAFGFHELGCEVDIGYGTPRPHDGVTVVLGAHLLALNSGETVLPDRTILVNLEQMTSWSGRNPHYARLLERYPVWDYSERNVAALQARPNRGVSMLRFGFAPPLERIADDVAEDIDVLFYGAVNARRRHILEALEARGIVVKALFGAFREERDSWIARSRIVLNMHFYDDHIFEIVRCSYLLANGKAVVSEVNADTEIEDEMRGAVCGVPYAMLADACEVLLAAPGARLGLAERGRRVFRKRIQSRLLADTIATTGWDLC